MFVSKMFVPGMCVSLPGVRLTDTTQNANTRFHNQRATAPPQSASNRTHTQGTNILEMKTHAPVKRRDTAAPLSTRRGKHLVHEHEHMRTCVPRTALSRQDDLAALTGLTHGCQHGAMLRGRVRTCAPPHRAKPCRQFYEPYAQRLPQKYTYSIALNIQY